MDADFSEASDLDTRDVCTIISCGGSELDSSSVNSDSAITSLLSRLKSPQPSTLARKRKFGMNSPPLGKKRGKGSKTYDPKSVSPAERVKTYQSEPFIVSNKELFCSACREELSVKKSTMDLHIKSHKHQIGKERLAVKEKHQLDITTSLKQYDDKVHPAGETLTDFVHVYRVNVVTALLKAEVPLSKLDNFRKILEENAYSISDSSHLRCLIPFVLQDKITKLNQQIGGKHVAIIFNCTTGV